MGSFKIAQLSDLHFSHVSYSLLQFLSKHWLGNMNLILKRQQEFIPQRLESLTQLLKGVDFVSICGDLTSTSHKKEFAEAARFIEQVGTTGAKPLLIPGNHDHYTKKSFRKKQFYSSFSSYFPEKGVSELSLKEHQLSIENLGAGWKLISLDTVIPTSWVSSQGYFSSDLEMRLQSLLEEQSNGEKIIIANHFPFFQHDSLRKRLMRGEKLGEFIQRFPQVKIYLHGHTHRHCIANLRTSNLPLILDSGSTTHRDLGSWNLLEIEGSRCLISVYRWIEKKWQISEQVTHYV